MRTNGIFINQMDEAVDNSKDVEGLVSPESVAFIKLMMICYIMLLHEHFYTNITSAGRFQCKRSNLLHEASTLIYQFTNKYTSFNNDFSGSLQNIWQDYGFSREVKSTNAFGL